MLEQSQNMFMDFFSLPNNTKNRLKNAVRENTYLSCLGLFGREGLGKDKSMYYIEAFSNILWKVFWYIFIIERYKALQHYAFMLIYQQNYLAWLRML